MKHATRILMLGCAMLVFAGAASAAAYQVGFKGGLAIQTLGGDDVESDDLESRTGFAGGAYFQADMSRNFGVRLEALYFMKGASASAGVDSFVVVDATVKLDYLEFPVLLMANIPISETGRLSVFGGPTFSFNTNAEVEASVNSFSGSVDIGDAVKGFDFGLTFGAGVSFEAGSVIVGVDGRYGFSLSSIAEEDFFTDTGVVVESDPDVKNQGFAIIASLGFPVGGE
jgi:hypothetical protein